MTRYRLVACCLLALLGPSAWAEPLITASEAALPPDLTPSFGTKAITRGPAIKVITPDAGASLVSPITLKVAFEPRGGATIDVSSVRLTYLRSPNVELLDRVKGSLTDKGLELKGADVPPGEHQIRVSVQDSEGRQSQAVVNLNVAK